MGIRCNRTGGQKRLSSAGRERCDDAWRSGLVARDDSRDGDSRFCFFDGGASFLFKKYKGIFMNKFKQMP
jgi:hypothetical protein